jgi:DNA repair exonuclease SbcCD ATPase subunit
MHFAFPRSISSFVFIALTSCSFFASFTDGIMTFVEVTSLRQVGHLNLRLAAVNENALKKHLVEIYRQQKEEIQALRSLSSTQKISVLSSTQPITNTQIFPPSPGKSTLGLSGNFVERCKQLEERVQLLDSSNSYLKQQNNQLEAHKSNLENKLGILEDESHKIKTDLAQARELATSKGYMAQISGLEHAMREKDFAITRLNDLLTSANESKSQLEASNKMIRESLSNCDKELQLAKAEINKANEIIKRMQEEGKNLKTTNKSHGHLLSQQENIINDLRSQYDLNKRELFDLRDQLDKRNRELGQKDTEMTNLKRIETDLKIRIEGLSTGTNFFYLCSDKNFKSSY